MAISLFQSYDGKKGFRRPYCLNPFISMIKAEPIFSANRKSVVVLAIWLLTMMASFPAMGNAQEWLRSQDRHAWARFQPESWKSVRVSHSLIDAAGKVTSEVITLTTTQLVEASRNQFTLSVESTVKIGEQQVNQSKERIKREINSKGNGFSEIVENSTIKIGDYEMPVEVFTVQYSTKRGKRLSKVFISKETMPSVLRRETTFTNKKGEVEYKTTSYVVEYGLTKEILGKQIQKEKEIICR